ncbi:MAG: HD domain-containing phosphohydrolase [Acidobacteriota bacterium]
MGIDAFKLKPTESTTAENLLKLAHTIDQFEQYTRPHASRLAHLAEMVATRIGLAGADREAVKMAALVHDIGELVMDAPGVRAGGHLDFKQRIELWRHPIIGEQQLAKRGLSRQVQLLVRWHHEWWNGAGYPDMLVGEAIPLGARILRLVDTYDALIAWRPYRDAFTEEQAIEIIAASAGIEFDPLLTKLFLKILAEMRQTAASLEKATLEPEVAIEVSPETELQTPTNNVSGGETSYSSEIAAAPADTQPEERHKQEDNAESQQP